MISPELLRRYPFFGQMDETQLAEIAMIAEDVSYESGDIILNEGDTADAFYFLLKGHVDLYFTVSQMAGSDVSQGIPVGVINPGEPFGISSMIEPHVLNATARATSSTRAIRIDAQKLRTLFEQDRRLAYLFTGQAAKAILDRLHFTRVQLAAAWA